MNISDLTYLEIATEANNLEGGTFYYDPGISLYDLGTSFYQHTQTVGGIGTSGPGGSFVIGNVVDNVIYTQGGLVVSF